ncbi:uncharacterized protein METZ01_LOCUS175372 [marine metagenome]|uniref:Uncharacterized protein n=1 Tax=marine metagenome TaxID=408172 RepID=A0A382C8T1_9ZZZZ
MVISIIILISGQVIKSLINSNASNF